MEKEYYCEKLKEEIGEDKAERYCIKKANCPHLRTK